MTITDIITDISHSFTIAVFVCLFLSKKKRRNFLFGIFSLTLILGFQILYFDYNSVNYEGFSSIFYSVSVFLFSLYYSQNQLTEKMMVSVLINIMLSLSNAFALLFLKLILNMQISEFLNSQFTFVLACLLSVITLAFISCLLVKVRNNINSLISPYSKYFVVIFILIYFSTIAIEYQLFNQIFDETLLLFSLILILIIFLFLLNVTFKYANDTIDKINQESLQHEIKYMQERFNLLEEKSKQISIVKHDLSKTMFLLNSYVESKEYHKIKELAQNISLEIDSSFKLVVTGIAVIDAVINSKSIECQQNKIYFTYGIDKSHLDYFDDYDIALILLNGLSNAIENISSRNKQISLNIIYRNNMLIIEITNTVSFNILEENPQLISHKKNKNQHGFGIKSMNKIAKKYNGSIHFMQDTDIFSCIVSLQDC